MHRRSILNLLLATLFWFIGLTYAQAQKTDKVVFLNGDYVIGEIMQLDKGKLRVDSKYTGKVTSDWADIVSITTDKTYLFQLEGGELYNGTFEFVSPENFRIITEDTTFTIAASSVTRLIMYDKRIWQRFEGSLGLGLDFSSASHVLKINLMTELAYVGPKYRSSVSFESLFTNITNDSTKYVKRDLNIDAVRFFGKSWFFEGEYTFEQNSELGFDGRHLLIASIGKNLLQTQKTDMLVMAGLNYNRESYTSAETGKQSNDNLELPVSTSFNVFQYDDPELNLGLDFKYFPSLTDLGRHRFNSSVKFKMEFFNDFWLSLEFYDDFDNRVPSTGKKRNDYGIISTISYSFD